MTVINELPAGARRISALLERRPREAPGPLEKVEQAAEELAKTDTPKPKPGVIRVQVEEPRVTATTLLWSGSIGAVAALNQLDHDSVSDLLHPALGQDVQEEVRRARGPDAYRRRKSRSRSSTISRSQIGRFLIVQIFTSVVVGVATWAALAWLGLEQAAFWGLLAGIFNSIPYYGPLHRQRRLWRSWRFCSSARST